MPHTPKELNVKFKRLQKMFRGDKTSYSARANAQENEILDAFFVKYQEKFNVSFTSFREFLVHVAANAALLENEAPTIENDRESIYVDEIQPQLKAYADQKDLPLESTAKDIVLNALTAEPEVIETPSDPVTETVERVLKENEILLDLGFDLEDEDGKWGMTAFECLQTVNTNRNKALRINGHPEEDLNTTAIRMLFNPPNVGNWSGYFHTGIE